VAVLVQAVQQVLRELQALVELVAELAVDLLVVARQVQAVQQAGIKSRTDLVVAA